MSEPVPSGGIVRALREAATDGAADTIGRRVGADEEVFGLRMRDVFEIARNPQDLRRHDSITSWDMVDRAAPRVIGGHLAGCDLAPLRDLARSADPLRRRTAITAPLFFTRSGTAAGLSGEFAIAAQLAADPEPVVHNAVGIFLKHAGTREPTSLRGFLQGHAARMPRPALRLAIEKLPPGERAAILAG